MLRFSISVYAGPKDKILCVTIHLSGGKEQSYGW